MKKYLCFFLCVLIVGSLCGCGQEDIKLSDPVNFYYPVKIDYRYDYEPMIQPEQREGKGYEKNLLGFTDRYMNGPENHRLRSVFPQDCYPVSVCRNGSRITVYMSPGFTKLTGIDLTLACSCLTMTLTEYTGAETINICVKDIKLDGQRTIIMSKNDFTLVDGSLTEVKFQKE